MTSTTFLFFILVKFIPINLFLITIINIIPKKKFAKPNIVFNMINRDTTPSCPKQFKVTQFAMNISVGIFGMILRTKSNVVEMIIKFIPIKKEYCFLLTSETVGKRIIKILSNPSVKIAIDHKFEVMFCRDAHQNRNGVT